MDMHKMKVGWNHYEFDEALIKQCAKNRIEVLEYDSLWNDESASTDYFKVQKIAEKYGIKLRSIHLSMGERVDISSEKYAANSLKIMKKQLDNASIAGVEYAVLHASSEPIENSEREKRLNNAAENAVYLCEYAKERGITICIENLPRSCICNCIDEVKFIVNKSPLLKVCFDVNHLLKDNHVDFFNAFKGKIENVHISDFDFKDDRHWIPGDGKIDWKIIKKGLEDDGYSGPFLYECDVTRRKVGSGALPLGAFFDIKENIASGFHPLYKLDNNI